MSRHNAVRRQRAQSSKTVETSPDALDRTATELVLRVAWLAILLGLVIQIALLAISAAFHRVPKLNPLIVDCAQRIAWSTIVCASISVAMVASKLRESFMGLAGLLSGALAFRIARSVQKGLGAALGIAPVSGSAPSPWVLGLLKAVEYACLAAVIAWLAKRKNHGAIAHASVGLAIGLVFGGGILAYTYWSNIKLLTAADVFSRGTNEILFPIGCSLVLFFTEVWAKQWKASHQG